MTCSVLVYSTDQIRGKILERTCVVAGYPAWRCLSGPQCAAALNTTVYDVVILDAAGADAQEMRRLAAICRVLKKSVVIVLAGTIPPQTAQAAGLTGAAVLPDPLDPEQTLALIQQVAEDKKKTAYNAPVNGWLPAGLRSGALSAAACCS